MQTCLLRVVTGLIREAVKIKILSTKMNNEISEEQKLELIKARFKNVDDEDDLMDGKKFWRILNELDADLD